MVRKLILSRGAALWEEGDRARSIALLEKGKLGVHMHGRLVGVVNPKMVLGEGAIRGLDGADQVRAATVTALADDTQVTEYSAAMVRSSWDQTGGVVGQRLLATLIGQTARNLVLALSTNRERAIVEPPVRGMLQGLIAIQPAVAAVKRWGEFVEVFRFLHALRDSSAAIRDLVIVTLPGEMEALERSSEIVRQLFKGQDLASLLDEHIAAEREKTAWPERSGA